MLSLSRACRRQGKYWPTPLHQWAALTQTTQLFFLFFHAPSAALAAFTHEACYHLDLVRQNNLDTFCYYPGVLRKNRPCTNDQLQTILDAHVNNALGSGLSIAYYSAEDGADLGNVGWNGWNTTTSPVAVCLSGAIDNLPNAFVSTCRYSTRDDDFDDPRAHVPECWVNLPQQRVVDGCYPVPTPVPTAAQTQHGYLSERTKDLITIVTTILGIPTTIALLYGFYKWVQRLRRHRREAAVNGLNNVALGDRSFSLTTVAGTETHDEASRSGDSSPPVVRP